LLKQVFFIGDGLAGDLGGQLVIAPPGATRLYLGTMDGGGWFNNTGEFSVSVTQVDAQFTNHIYRAVSGSLTWHQAEADAEARGGHLATITSQAELDYILALGILPNETYWLGATDEGHEGVWTWVTGEPWEFSAWAAGEPNNSGPENYLVGAVIIGHRWNDVGTESATVPFYLLESDPPGCSPHKARATPELVNGFLVGATITDAGCGYTNAPLVLIQGGGGSGATATAVITNGRVTRIIITDAGFGYDTPPRIVIASPPFVPTLAISVSRVKVAQNVVLGRRYVLESSTDLANWGATGTPFTAESETIENEFDVNVTGGFFRIREVP
jgi:hypothetical protein